MTTWAVLATGPSLTKAQVAAVRHLPCVAVSDAFRLAPWAAAMAAQDRKWWEVHADALAFAGRKFSTRGIVGVERVPIGPVVSSTNSGLLAVHVARMLGATRVLLLGVDMKGTHYFGPHRHGLKNTGPERFNDMRRQFARYPRGDLEIINCSPGSALDCFPKLPLEQCLDGHAMEGPAHVAGQDGGGAGERTEPAREPAGACPGAPRRAVGSDRDELHRHPHAGA